MAKVRVAVLGTVGKTVSFDAAATVGAQLGVNLFAEDGVTLLTRADFTGNTFPSDQAEAVAESGVTDHGILTGLADDDHPQYAEHANPETISAVWNFTAQPTGINHVSLGLLNADDHLQYLLLAGRAGGQIAFGGANTGDNLTLDANPAAGVNTGRIVMRSAVEFESISETGAPYAFNYDATENYTGTFVGGGLNMSGNITFVGGTFIYESFRGAPTINTNGNPGFAAYTVLQALPTLNSGPGAGHNPLPPLILNAGVQVRHAYVGTRTVSSVAAVNFASTMVATVSGAVLNCTNWTGLTVAPKWNTAAGSTISFGNITGVDVQAPAQGLFSSSAGTERMSSFYGMKVANPGINNGVGTAPVAAIRSEILTGTNRYFLLNAGTAHSDHGSAHMYFDDNFGIAYGGNGITNFDYWESWNAAGYYRQFFLATGDEVRFSSPSADRFLWTTNGGNTVAEFNFDCAKATIGAQTGAIGNGFLQFIAPARTTSINGDWTDVLITAAGNLTVANTMGTVATQVFNAPSITNGGGTIVTHAAVQIGGNPSGVATVNRVGLHILSNPVGGSGVNAALWVENGLAVFGNGIDVTGNIVVTGTVDGRDVSTDGTNQDNHIADASIHFTQAAIDHTAILNIGTNTHAQIDTHIADGTIHFTQAAISITASQVSNFDTAVAANAAVAANTAKVTNATHTGQVTGSGALALDITAITAQPASGAVVGTDTMLINDGGVLSEVSITQLSAFFGGGTGTVTSVAAGNGMDFVTITGAGSVVMGTPGSLSNVTVNAVTATSHTHAITGFEPTLGFTAADDSLVVHLAGVETITGAKTFTADITTENIFVGPTTQKMVMLEADATVNRSYIATRDIGGTERKILVRGSSLDRINFSNVNFDTNIQWKDNLLFNGVIQTPANWDTAFSWGNHALAGYAPLASPVFTGNPTAPTPLTADNDTSIATTAFVKAQGYASGGPFLPLAGGTMTGVITGDDNVSGALTTPGASSVVRFGSYGSLSRLFSSAATTLANNAHVDPADAVASQMRTSVTHPSYGHTIYEMAAGIHRWYGISNSVTAGAVVVKVLQMTLGATGNLSVTGRVDSDYFYATELGPLTSPGSENLYAGGYGIMGERAGSPVYVTNASATGQVAINAGGVHGSGNTRLLVSTSSIDALETLRVRTGNIFRVFDAANQDFIEIRHLGTSIRIAAAGTGGGAEDIVISAGNSNAVILEYNTVDVFQSQQHNATGNTTGAQVKDHNGIMRDVGMQTLSIFNSNVSDTLEARHSGTIQTKTTTTARTLTLAAVADLDFPVSHGTQVINGGTSGNYTITEGASTTLFYLEPGVGLVDTTGGCTIGPGGVATILRIQASVYYIWGSEITYTP